LYTTHGARLAKFNRTPGQLLPGVHINVYAETTENAGARPLWLLADLPPDLSVPKAAGLVAQAKTRLETKFTQLRGLVTEIAWPDGAAPAGAFHEARLGVLLPPQGTDDARRSRAELATALTAELNRAPDALAWRADDDSPQHWLDAFVPGPADGLIKIIGPDLARLEQAGRRAEARLKLLPGVAGVRVLSGKGPLRRNWVLDPGQCARRGVQAGDASTVLSAALDGRLAGQMVEGEKRFVVMVRWPERLRRHEADLLDLPVDVAPLPLEARPAVAGPVRVRLRDLVAGPGQQGGPARAGAAVIYREDGKRLLPIRFRVETGRDVAAVAGQAQEAIQGELPPGYSAARAR
jgi:cobalt-zinc-cadmium resistance protein CzcA